MKRTVIASSSFALFVAVIAVVACAKPQAGPTTAVRGVAQPAPGASAVAASGGVTVETVTDSEGRSYQIQQGPRGDASTLGCADGQREAFVDHNAFPHIAGCIASWEGQKSMRGAPTGTACGDDSGPCATPADACAPGWHVCASNGHLSELRQVSAEQCASAGGGRFSAGVSHCVTQSGCEYDMTPAATYSCFDSGWCSETVCCGSDCGEFGACTGGVWPDQTHIAFGMDQGCGASTSQRAGGVLCCNN
ncbi:MAG: hypothetical protein IPK60_19895 [Sandaracinaceae bacterium]|nr:hypothetical protein [Sandaracinaceae bacterium]